MTSSQDALKQHLVPLTSLVCRALDLEAEADAAVSSEGRKESKRRKNQEAIAEMALRYLDTDTLLCWAPEPREGDPLVLRNTQGESLYDVQARAAREVAGYLARWVWPGIVLRPVLPEGSIMPVPQDEGVRDVVHGWVLGLDAWELAGLERAVLAGKGLLVAARLVVEWADSFRELRTEARRQRAEETGKEKKLQNQQGDYKKNAFSGGSDDKGGNLSVFGVEEAARAASIEVDWQTGNWGEVEDTHDVDKEDLRRHLGSVVLLVSGKSEPET